MTPQNYVWCVNNKITGITIAIYYKPENAEEMAAENIDLMVKKMEIS
jgi:quinol-cytochrome oxidoreductase complex cytochrome b subunit